MTKKHFIWVGILVLGVCIWRQTLKTPSQLPVSPVRQDVVSEIKNAVKKNEKYYAAIWSKMHQGKVEYLLEDRTRVDVVTAEYAIEIDFAPKWYQAIGQSLHYALQTKKDPGIVLISKSNKDEKYIDRLVAVIQEYDLPVTVWQMTENAERMVYKPIQEFIHKEGVRK